MKPQRGYSTLLLTSLVLLIVLIVMTGSYRSMFQYLRIVDHRIATMQQDWQAEGAIECVFANAKVGQLFPLDVEECGADVDQLNVTGNLSKRINSISGFSSLTRDLLLPSADTAGAIKASANLVLTEDSIFSPDPGELDDDFKWQCVSVRYRHHLFAPSVTTYHPYQQTLTPYLGFPDSDSQQQRCADNHHSVRQTAAGSQNDFYRDSELSPFEDLFGVAASNWFSVFANSAVGRIPQTLDSNEKLSIASAVELPQAQLNATCAADIASRIGQGKDLIWVYGGCALNESDISNINQAVKDQFDEAGIILVVHNGILAIESQQTFQGLVMQFTSPESGLATFTQWETTVLHQNVTEFMASFSSADLLSADQISYFQVGRFNPLGGLALSSNNTFAVIEGRLNFQYQRDLVSKSLAHIRPAQWLFGSWGDEYANSN